MTFSPVSHQAIISTNVDLLLIVPLRTNFSEIAIKIKIFIAENAFENIVCKMAILSRLEYDKILEVPRYFARLVHNFVQSSDKWNHIPNHW